MVEPTDPQADDLPAAHHSVTGPTVIRHELNRADRRALLGTGTQPAADLLMARVGSTVFVGIRHGGNVRLTTEQARQAATALEGLTDIAELDEGSTDGG